MSKTSYRAEFFTAADHACRLFEADTPEQALQLARQFYDDDIIELDFRSYDDIEPLDQIQICNSSGRTVATWESADFRLRRAAPKLLEACQKALSEIERLEAASGVAADDRLIVAMGEAIAMAIPPA
jgi:hypothetical protein